MNCLRLHLSKAFKKVNFHFKPSLFNSGPIRCMHDFLCLEQCFLFIHLSTVKVVWSYSLYVWLPVPEPCSHLSTCPQRINLSWKPRVLKSFLNQLALQYVKGFLKSQFSLQAILFQYDHVHCMRDFLSENNVFFSFFTYQLAMNETYKWYGDTWDAFFERNKWFF